MSVPTYLNKIETNKYSVSIRRTINDKLWLFSANELFGSGLEYVFNDRESGSQMSHLAELGITQSSYESMVLKDISTGSKINWWLRSPDLISDHDVTMVCDTGQVWGTSPTAHFRCGLAPGFCLKTLDTAEEHEDE